jgi:RimJ/RimL family protein N-acetyltransferase
LKKSKKEERIIFLEGKKVILRPLNKRTDLEKTVKWINDPDVRQFVSNFLPVAEQEEEKWFDNRRDNDIVLIIETKDGKSIGTMGLHKIDYRNGLAITGALIGEKDYWGKGYGTDAKMILLNYAFNVLNLRKIKSGALAFNGRSINYNKKCGYKEEGVLKKEIFVNGEYVDMVQLAVFKKDFLPLWKKYQNGSIK